MICLSIIDNGTRFDLEKVFATGVSREGLWNHWNAGASLPFLAGQIDIQTKPGGWDSPSILTSLSDE